MPIDINGDGLVNNVDSTLITNFLTVSGTSSVDTVIGAVDSIVNFEYTSTTLGDAVSGLVSRQTIVGGPGRTDQVTQY